jgi:hypothetical protein
MIRSLVKVTAWEKVSPVRRLLCAFGRVSILVAVLLVISYSIFAHRYVIEAKIWHWRHGYTTTIGSYEIPVPDHWVILNQDSTFFTMANASPTRPQRDNKFHTTAVVSVDVGLSGLRRHSGDANWMDFWISFEHQRLAKQKVQSVAEKALKFEEESITCIGGNELNAILQSKPNLPQTDAVSLNCMSDRGLNLMFVGEPPDVQPFYIFLSQIRRKS